MPHVVASLPVASTAETTSSPMISTTAVVRTPVSCDVTATPRRWVAPRSRSIGGVGVTPSRVTGAPDQSEPVDPQSPVKVVPVFARRIAVGNSALSGVIRSLELSASAGRRLCQLTQLQQSASAEPG